MKISVSEAKGQLTELVRRAEAGEDVVLTRHGNPVVRLSPVAPRTGRAARHDLMRQIIEEARRDPNRQADAARSQDFLYDDDGLPG